MRDSIVILDFGGQYAHLIASRVRRLGAFSEIREAETSAEELKDAAGIILSGGPASVYDEGSPKGDPKIFELGIPVMGLCYGLHWMTQALGGEVEGGKVKEYGKTEMEVVGDGGGLLRGLDEGEERSRGHRGLEDRLTVWMSHGDEAVKLPEGFERIATSSDCANAAFADEDRKLFALQFHPEVTHTEHGEEILKRFVSLCDAEPWSIESYAKQVGQEIIEEVGDRKVFMLVSGGVDSTVAFTLLNEVLGQDRVQGLLVDTGLMRKDEVKKIEEAFAPLGIANLHIEDASDEFFQNLEGVYDPEKKREVIGETFLDVQKRVSEEMDLKMEDGWMLGQGTIYPDTIETGATKHADKIKTHHNRVEAVQKMIDEGLVIEPLKDLYKDEVRRLGEELGLPHELVWRHPFPGPGLGVRILCVREPSPFRSGEPRLSATEGAESIILPVRSVGVQGDGRTYRHAVALFSDQPCVITSEQQRLATEIPNANREINRVLVCTSQSDVPELTFTPGFLTKKRADLLREADAIVDEEMHRANLYESIWQFPVVLVPFGTSEGGQSIVLRPIASVDVMTVDAVILLQEVLERMTRRIMEISGIDLVFLDLTSKPPGTVEWE